jgi:hypothetical protein
LPTDPNEPPTAAYSRSFRNARACTAGRTEELKSGSTPPIESM